MAMCEIHRMCEKSLDFERWAISDYRSVSASPTATETNQKFDTGNLNGKPLYVEFENSDTINTLKHVEAWKAIAFLSMNRRPAFEIFFSLQTFLPLAQSIIITN